MTKESARFFCFGLIILSVKRNNRNDYQRHRFQFVQAQAGFLFLNTNNAPKPHHNYNQPSHHYELTHSNIPYYFFFTFFVI